MSPTFKRVAFYAGFAVDCIALLVAVYFLVSDSIGFTSADNTGLLIATLLFGGWLWLCWYLQSKGAIGIAALLAWIPGLPLLLFGLFTLLFIILDPDMR